MRSITIGSRGSALALAQTNLIGRLLEEANPGIQVSIQVIRTTGDKMTAASLAQLASETKGLFVKEIEDALTERTIDVAVHSLKDLPTELPPGLILGAVPVREDPRDALIGREPWSSLDELPLRARVGTSSLRRQLQLEHRRPDVRVYPIRGNVDTRIRKLQTEELDAILLAAAGLNRLGLEDKASFMFPVDQMVPAIGQGALAIECREDDTWVLELLAPLEDPATRIAVTAERSFLGAMGGGCQVPLGAHAVVRDAGALFSAFMASPSGTRVLQRSIECPGSELDREAVLLAGEFKAGGGDEILAEVGIH